MDAAVIEVLQRASSQDPSVLKKAEQTLKEWETERGFYTALYNVYSNHSLPIDVRWMAILCFKNGIDVYWRKTAPNAIAEDEKEFLRQRLLSNFDESVNQLAIQIAVTIGKISRLDWPREWTTLIPTLLEVIGGQNAVAQHRAMLTLHQVVKTLASKRLAMDQRLFDELKSNTFTFILNLWNSFTESFLILASNNADVHQIQEAIEKALLLLKILRKMIMYGFSKPSESPDVMLFLKVIFERARTCLECRKTLISRGIQMEVCDKFIIHLTKVPLGILDLHPYCYVELIPISLEFCVFYCFTEAGQPFTFERFIIQCLYLLNRMLILDKIPRTSRGSDDVRLTQARRYCKEFFTTQTIREICTRLVTHYLLLTPADLELWDTDPESFAAEVTGGSWKYNLKQCTRLVFTAILGEFKEVPESVLADLLQRHHQPVDPNDLHAILLKDAVYCAVGFAAFELYERVDFDQWFSTTLKQEMKMQGPNYKIIRRRICWLIGHWVGVRINAKLRPELYKLIVESLNPEEDLSVRLAASDALKRVIDDFVFKVDEFAPVLETAFSRLFTLLKESSECDTKMRVLYVLSFMIERVGCRIKPFINSLTSYLPALWQQSDEHNMLRCAIVLTLVHLEKALGSESVILEPLVVEVVSLSCDVNQDGHVYLLGDGLELWLALLENAPALTPPIMGLFKNMPALLDCSSGNLRLCLYIIQAYVLLNPMEFLCEHGTIVVGAIKYLLDDTRPEGIVLAIKLFETCLKAVPQQGSRLIEPLLCKIFENVYKSTEHPKVMTMSLSIVARVLLDSKDMFAQVISELAREIGNDATEESVLARIIQAWIDHMSVVTQPERLKLLSLAFCSLLCPNSPPIVFQQFPHIITYIVESLNDIMRTDDMNCSVDSLMINEQESPSQWETDDYETEHELRRKKLAYTDPVHNVSLKDTLQNQLTTLRRVMGDDQFQQMLQTLRSDVDQQLKKYVTL